MICTILEVFYVWRYHKQAFSAGSAIGNGTNCLSIVLCTISVSCIRRKKTICQSSKYIYKEFVLRFPSF